MAGGLSHERDVSLRSGRRVSAAAARQRPAARLDEQASTTVGQLAVAAHRLLGLRDISRTDAVVTPDGVAQFLEVNVAPGLTETSLLPMALTTDGTDLGAAYSALVDRAVRRGA